MMRRTTITAAGTTAMACAAALALSACGPSFEGSGSKDAASAEQLALREPDPWAEQVEVDPNARASEDLQDGVYTGSAPAMAGMVTVTLLVEDEAMGPVIDRFGTDVTTHVLPDGRARVHAMILESPTFYGWLAQFGKAVEIEGPRMVRQRYVEYIRGLLDMYE